MGRYEKLNEFIAQYDNINFNSTNIPKVYANLVKADRDGRLKDFFLDKKPYQSSFKFFVFNDQNKASRKKDQVAIVFALNLYGMKNPGFVVRLNTVLKELARGSRKAMDSVAVLRNAQLELQNLEISLIDFFDEELLLIMNNYIKKAKGPTIALMVLFIVGGSCGAPGFSMIGLPLFSLVSVVLMFYGFIKLIYWISVIPLTDEAIRESAKPVREYREEPKEENENKQEP